jgi:hypothetical protein
MDEVNYRIIPGMPSKGAAVQLRNTQRIVECGLLHSRENNFSEVTRFKLKFG